MKVGPLRRNPIQPSWTQISDSYAVLESCPTKRVGECSTRCTMNVGKGVTLFPPPNGWRLSCGAELRWSQTECYHTACRMFSEPVDDGRRQLQARVRRRLISSMMTSRAPANLLKT